MTQNIDTLYHLTPLQHGMLFHSLREPGSGVYVEHFSCRLQGPLDVARFRAAWQGVVQRHDSLKTLFLRLQEEKPVQVVRREVPLPFTELDWRDLPAAEQDRRFAQLLHDDRQRGFDPAVAPLMRLYLIALGQGGWRFLWSFHHAILDGWSTPVVLQEVFRLYGGGPALPPPQRRFRDHVAWLRGRDRGDSLSFWKARLKGWRRPLAFSPALLAPESAPAAGPRPVLRLRTALPAAWNDAATRCCREAQVTLNTLCQGAWALLLGLLADRDEVVHGLVFSGRFAELPGADRLVGLCLNTVPLRAALPAGQGLHEWLRALQADTVQTERHADCPLTEIASCAELPPGQPLFDAIYVFENYPGHAAFQALAGAHGLQASEACAQEQTHYGLALVVQPGEALHCELICDATRTPPASAEAVLHHYLHLLQCMVDGGDRRLDQLGLDAAPAFFGPPAPQAATAVSFLSRLQSHPGDAGCWADASQALSYSRLRRWLQQACRQWQLAGVRPGQRVLLVADDELQLLVLLLSGMACGVDCLVPGTDLPTLLGAGIRAWGECGPRPPPASGHCQTAGPAIASRHWPMTTTRPSTPTRPAGHPVPAAGSVAAGRGTGSSCATAKASCCRRPTASWLPARWARPGRWRSPARWRRARTSGWPWRPWLPGWKCAGWRRPDPGAPATTWRAHWWRPAHAGTASLSMRPKPAS
ncbi:condensation domain-containing protein [Eleftheria terrae]|uniref:condensation domain-containing protein n=1 Tax=Eleftheria terrae TaxID=1597781 RepID=UPI00263AA601|nr:condensation domain-containing protein [Eleftheria terrae]WKB53462.1 condensation domain-containing protein [Eleftheria terrae]